MTFEAAEKVAKAVLYEGYMLYPYRPSALKNQQRWTFGTLYPPTYEEVRAGIERSTLHAECLMLSSPEAVVQIRARFLQLGGSSPEQASSDSVERSFDCSMRLASACETSGSVEHARREGSAALQRRGNAGSLSCTGTQPTASSGLRPELRGTRQNAGLKARTTLSSEPFASCGKQILGSGAHQEAFRFVNETGEIRGSLRIECEHVPAQGVSNDAATFKLRLDLSNESECSLSADRDNALSRSLLSAHLMLGVEDGQFVSLLDPPPELQQAVASCKNVGCFPVLVGDEEQRNMLLCSPIILYDFPQIAPESAGDFFDGTEMDEMLTLRVITMTDEEKQQMNSTDTRLHDLLERTERTAREQLMRTHGTIRSMRPVSEHE